MIEEPAHSRGEALAGASGPSRARRLLAGWSANLFQMILGVTQQVALVPVFLHYWTSDVLAAWLAIYAAGNLILIADAGLQLRSINRFLGFKAGVDCDGRTASFYAAMLRIYFGVAGALIALLLVGTRLLPPSSVLGFQAIPNFDAAFVLMTVGMLLTLPSNLVSGLYRARGLYGRAVRLQNWIMLFAQIAQLAAIVATGSLLAVTMTYVVAQLLIMAYFLAIDAPRMFPFLRRMRATHSWRWIAGQFRKAAPFAVAGATELALVNLPVLLVSAFVSNRMAVAQWGLTRIAAGLLRTLCVQTTLPLAAELGHDYAVGLKDQLRSLYARGSVFVTLLASLVVSGLLPFWPDFFALWTHGAVPYDSLLTMTLLIGTQRDRAIDPGAGLRQLQQSWRPPGADQGTSACGIPDSIGDADSRDRAVGGGGGGCRQRPVDSVRVARAHHHRANAATAASAYRLSRSGDGVRDIRGLGARNDHPLGGCPEPDCCDLRSNARCG